MRITEVAIFIGLLWLIEFYNSGVGHQLSAYGIRPRSESGLVGIMIWPLLHANASHLLANTIPLAILSWFLLLQGFRRYLLISFWITVIAGIAVWIFARPAVHVGASGLIFGYFGFLVAAAWYEKSLVSFIFAILTVFLYGGLVWGVLPQAPHISWEAHLFGMLAGIFLASQLKPSKPG